ncbi:SUMO1 sentrin specific peptidase 1 [Tulasnella sp. 418]|nr:SUMO1 sentrin specific peptidase 1 [Tulasnella sp. 418]
MSTGKLKTGIHITNSGMVQKLEGCTDVDHWFKKIDVFSLEHLIVPVNVNSNHWAVVAIDFPSQSIMYFDSLESTRQWRRDLHKIILDWLKSHWGRKDTTSKGAFVAVKWASGQLLMFDDTPEQVTTGTVVSMPAASSKSLHKVNYLLGRKGSPLLQQMQQLTGVR